MSSTSITPEEATITVSPRLAQLLCCVNVCEAETFNPVFKSDNAALEEFVALKRRLRREYGMVSMDRKRARDLQFGLHDFDSSFLEESRPERQDDREARSKGRGVPPNCS